MIILPIMPSAIAFFAFHHWSAEVVCDPTWTHAFALVHGVDQFLGFLDRVAHGLFEIDVLALVHGL